MSRTELSKGRQQTAAARQAWNKKYASTPEAQRQVFSEMGHASKRARSRRQAALAKAIADAQAALEAAQKALSEVAGAVPR